MTGATAAAVDLPRLPLEDALLLVLRYCRAGDRRFERAALRFHQRLCQEEPALGLQERERPACPALNRQRRPGGVATLCALLEHVGSKRLVAVLDAWCE